MQIKTDYNLIGKLQYFIAQENLSIISSEYTDIVTLELMIPLNMVTGFQKLSDLSNGTISGSKIKRHTLQSLTAKYTYFNRTV